MSRSLLDEAFEQHAWATLWLIDTCLSLTQEQLNEAVPGTYGSTLQTGRHFIRGDLRGDLRSARHMGQVPL